MNIREVIQSDIEKSIKNCGLGLVVPVNVAYPTDLTHGDYTTNWPLQAAQKLQQSPLEVARKIEAIFVKSEVYNPPTVAEPGFLNFNLKPDFLAKHLRLAVAEGDKFGFGSLGAGKKVIIEFSSPNIAKPMHIGHLRNTNIGQAISNILSYNGYQTITDNHIGDWGTQFGKLLYAYKSWGKEILQPRVDDLLSLYVKFHSEAAANPELDSLARLEFKKLEDGDAENRELWERFRKISLAEFERVYQELGVSFTTQFGESFYEKDLSKLVTQVLASGAGRKDPDGSVIIPLEGLPPFLILKSDGATLYGTRDLATAKYRIDNIKPDQVLYVIGTEQSLYMQQLFAALKKLGWGENINWKHISYGLTRLPQGKMSTRAGEMVTAEEILTEAYAKAEQTIGQKDGQIK
ncbi:MAG TPA: arginine--tRNA ligase, partial [Patescibacteria group bacterium]|nr:arginine--tRNA ligase [Patescibacteria group bacterium]